MEATLAAIYSPSIRQFQSKQSGIFNDKPQQIRLYRNREEAERYMPQEGRYNGKYCDWIRYWCYDRREWIPVPNDLIVVEVRLSADV